MTPDEFLAFERASTTRHEYIDGEIRAMAGASERHIDIQVDLQTLLNIQLRGKPCKVFNSEMRVQLASGNYTYPDASVVCGERQFRENTRPDTLLNPTVIIEVISPSTAAYDHTDKLTRYMAIESVRQIVLVEQDAPGVICYTRGDNGGWQFSAAIGLDSTLALDSIGCTLALADVYAKVTFPPAEDHQEA